MKDSDKELFKTTGIVAIDSIIAGISASKPEIGVALFACRGLVQSLTGNALKLRKNRALEFIEAIIKNPGTFTAKLMKTEEFQDGFVYALEKYIRERNTKKRIIAQRIFLGFATSEDKSRFDLERYYEILSKISTHGLEYLYFIKYTILPLYIAEARKEASKIIKQPNTEGNLEFWIEIFKRDHPISDYIIKWISDNFNPNSEKVKKKFGLDLSSEDPKNRNLINEQRTKDTFEQKKYQIALPELISLGFVLVNNDSAITGRTFSDAGGMIKYHITNFMENFLNFME